MKNEPLSEIEQYLKDNIISPSILRADAAELSRQIKKMNKDESLDKNNIQPLIRINQKCFLSDLKSALRASSERIPMDYDEWLIVSDSYKLSKGKIFSEMMKEKPEDPKLHNLINLIYGSEGKELIVDFANTITDVSSLKSIKSIIDVLYVGDENKKNSIYSILMKEIEKVDISDDLKRKAQQDFEIKKESNKKLKV